MIEDGQEYPDGLVPIERRILDHLRAGVLDAEIAVRLGVSVGDVKERTERMLAKTGLATRAELAAWRPDAMRPVPRLSPAGEAPAAPGEGEPPAGEDQAPPPRRYSRRAVLAGGAAAAAAVAGGVVALTWPTRGSPRETAVASNGGPQPAPSGSPVTYPPGRFLFTGLAKSVDHAFDSRTFAQSEVIDWQHGIFFMDIASGQVHGFAVVPSIRGTGILPPSDYRVSPGGRFISATSPDVGVLALQDRRAGGSSFTLPLESARLAGWSTERLLFERMDGRSTGTGEFYVTDGQLNEVTSFQLGNGATLQDGLFAPGDASLVMWLVPPGQQNVQSVLCGINLSTGDISPLWRPAVQMGQYRGRPLALELTADGFTARIAYDQGTDGTFAPPGSVNSEDRIFTWPGTIRFAGSGNAARPPVTLSSRGQPLSETPIYESGLPGVDVGDGRIQGEYWPAVLAGADDAGTLFRVRSAALRYGDNLPSRRWLADGSAFVAMVASGEPSGPAWERVGYALIAADGSSISMLPRPDVQQPALDPLLAGPVPHPTDPDLLAWGRVAVYSIRNGTFQTATIKSNPPAHLDPWGAGPNELVFALPHTDAGTGYPIPILVAPRSGEGLPFPTLIAPRIERPPFPSGLEFRVARTDGGCLNVRAAPDPSADVLVCLPEGTSLTVAPDTSNARRDYPWSSEATDSGLWVRVATAAPGPQGWVSASFLDWSDD